MRKSDRHKVIKRVIIDNEIETQDELLNYLKRENIYLTQSTISRDLRELKIVKSYIKDGKKKLTLIAEAPNEDQLEKKLKKSINDYTSSIRQINFLIILHTMPNGATVIANYMDEIEFADVVATVASYDTLIIVTRSEYIAQHFAEKLNQYMNVPSTSKE